MHQLAVVDPDSRQPVEWGEVGELVIGGVGTARYLDPEKDAAKFRPLPALGWDRAYCSGDLVRAVCEEEELTIAYYWNVTPFMVERWKRAISGATTSNGVFTRLAIMRSDPEFRKQFGYK